MSLLPRQNRQAEALKLENTELLLKCVLLEKELTTLRAKAKAYDEGFWRWAVYNEKMSMVGRMRPSPDLAKRDFMRLSIVWSDEESDSMWEYQYARIGYTCRKVRVCKEVENEKGKE